MWQIDGMMNEWQRITMCFSKNNTVSGEVLALIFELGLTLRSIPSIWDLLSLHGM